MPQLIWSPRALRDIQRIYRFLYAKNPKAAKRAVAAIRRGITSLADFPDAGQAAPDLGIACRRWLVRFGRDGYVVVYRTEPDFVLLLSLRHQKETVS
ncbi:type II toxin-antitoxin system RelE/ParE family toxin [Oxalobacteraceae bacterium]|nr:type II toxin-antitoxin system RelE/ParE family toxin [Oxalobacteraceae bacterium]